MAEKAPSDNHRRALAFADHWRDRGYVHADAADALDAQQVDESGALWIVGDHAISGSVAGVAIVCPIDCPSAVPDKRAYAS